MPLRASAPWLLMAAMLTPGGVGATEDLARSRNCLSCHAVDRKLVGPSFRSVAARYADDGAALDRLALKVRRGGSGVWGNAVMPPHPQVSETESRRLVGWILGLK